jgi:hypothetical protein
VKRGISALGTANPGTGIAAPLFIVLAPSGETGRRKHRPDTRRALLLRGVVLCSEGAAAEAFLFAALARVVRKRGR